MRLLVSRVLGVAVMMVWLGLVLCVAARADYSFEKSKHEDFWRRWHANNYKREVRYEQKTRSYIPRDADPRTPSRDVKR